MVKNRIWRRRACATPGTVPCRIAGITTIAHSAA